METKKRFVDFAETATPAFDSILQTMVHTRKGEGTRFLRAVNNLLDYVLSSSPENGSVNYHVIHIPACPEWARELLIRFTIYKAALTLNATIVKRCPSYFNKVIQLTSIQNKKDYLPQKRRKDYYRRIYQLFNVTGLPENDNKSLIVTKEQDMKSTKSNSDPWITELFSDKIEDDRYNVTVSAGLSALELEKTIRRLDTSLIPNVENIFIFHSPNKSQTTQSYNKTQLERLNRYGLGIKNCIVFSLSEQSFRLYGIMTGVKQRLVSSILTSPVRKYDDFAGFISFTQEEADYMFNRRNNQLTFFIDCENRPLLSWDVDQFFDQLPHNLRYRNHLALTLSDASWVTLRKSISEEAPELSLDRLEDFFNLNRHLWTAKAKGAIDSFIGDSRRIGFIIPKELIDSAGRSVIRLFQNPDRSIYCFSLEEIRKQVNVEKIVVLQFRYTDKFYKSYPNSFDPLPIRDEQSALVVINMLTHGSYYEWNHYGYEKDKNGLLYSAFRQDLLGWEKRRFKRPALNKVNEHIGEAESDAREYQTEKCKVYYKTGARAREYLACDRALYEDGSLLRIASLKDISALENLSIQMIDDIIDQVKVLISKKSQEKMNVEALYRRDPKFHLSEEEAASPVELWKILLKRRISMKGEQAVYEALFSSIPEGERVSLHTFNQWHNFDNDMILPRSRKHQKALWNYLGEETGQTYQRIIISKKLSSIHNSRLLNYQIETLLHRSLVTIPDEKSFEEMSESLSDIFILLSINNLEDLKALISLLEISLTPIEKIEYDPD